MFAFIRELPVFFSQPERPFRFDYLDPEVDLSSLRLENESRSLKTFGEDKVVGIPKHAVWERLLFILSLRGDVPLHALCNSMRYDGKSLIFSDEYKRVGEVRFNQCFYFGDAHCYKLLKEKRVDTGTYICYDWISFNRGGKHNVDFIETDDEFVRYLWFYPSDRIDGNSPVKDACVVSHLTQEQLSDFDYSETMARFKTVHEMEKRGMKGVFNGYGPNGKPKYYKFRTTHTTRRVEKEKGQNETTDTHIQIPRCTESGLLKDLSALCLDRDRFLRVE